MVTKEQDEWLKSTLKINVKHADVDTDVGNEHGFMPRAKGAGYEGENEKQGWRAGDIERRDGETDAAYAKRMAAREETHLVTRHFDDKEREDAKRPVDAKGVVRDEFGDRADGEYIYVTDPETGEMFVAVENEQGVRKMDADGKPTGPLLTARAGMREMINAKTSGGRERYEITHHSSPLKGEDVASAGTVKLEDGKVSRITNASGHYKPQFVHLLQVVEHLVKSGAMLETEVVDYKGGSVKDTQPKAYALYKKLQPMLADLPKERVRLLELEKQLSDEIDEDAAADIDGAIEEAKSKINVIQRAMAALAKMGIGPRNAMSDLTTVGVMNIKSSMTGAEAREVKPDEMPLQDFLMGKGAGEALEEMRSPDDEDEDASFVADESIFADEGNPYAKLNLENAGAEPAEDEEDEDDDPSFVGVDADLEGEGNPYAKLNLANAEAGAVVEDEDSEDDEEEASDDAADKKLPYRDFAAKGAMLEEFKQKLADGKLSDMIGKAEVSEGEAPEVDAEEWAREIDGLLDDIGEFEELEDPDEPAPSDGTGAAVAAGSGAPASAPSGYATFVAGSDGRAEDQADEPETQPHAYATVGAQDAEFEGDEEDASAGDGRWEETSDGYASFKSGEEADEGLDAPAEAYDELPPAQGYAGVEDSEETGDDKGDGYATYAPSQPDDEEDAEAEKVGGYFSVTDDKK